MKEIIGRIHSVETFGAVDGPGIRYVLFMQGCRLRCLYCHNPDTWAMGGGCDTTVSDVIEDIGGYYNFIKDGGVTLSGGEPLLQKEFTLELIRRVKSELKLHTAIDTAGAVPLEEVQEIIDEVDLVLLDIKSPDKLLFHELTGGELDNPLRILQYRDQQKKPVWVRHVILPGYTSSVEHSEQLAQLLSGYSCIEQVELLSFHKMGEFKWEQLGYKYKLTDTPPPTPEEMERAAEPLRKKGFTVSVK